ncbi:MAG: threonine aldolase [Synergistaceae bacterium]|nr:threonine aldolase [Synergistaceae bacterium]
MDFRSDTVTQPTDRMREAMAAAVVGDDVYGDDPTVNELQEYAAALTGMESSLYVCSGTMGNLVSVMSHCCRGEGVLLGVNSHMWRNEGGNMACVAGVMPFPLDDSSGLPSLESIKSSYMPSGNVHYANTTMLAMENTHNSAGGIPAEVGAFAEAADLAKDIGLLVHVDGARIFDAAEYFGVDVKEYSRRVDSIQICLSKGLGAPMGSIVCGSRSFIDRARKFRKLLGGGQRQAGVAAAAGLIALKEMRGRLSDDHSNASLLASLLSGLEEHGIDVEPARRRTNMVYFKIRRGIDAISLIDRCSERGLLISLAGPGRIRMVTHLGLDEGSVRCAVVIIGDILKYCEVINQ